MTGAEGPAEAEPELPSGAAADAATADLETAELVAQIRELAGDDPADVRQVVAEVLAALDRVSGGDLGSRYSDAYPGDVQPGEDPPPPDVGT